MIHQRQTAERAPIRSAGRASESGLSGAVRGRAPGVGGAKAPSEMRTRAQSPSSSKTVRRERECCRHSHAHQDVDTDSKLVLNQTPGPVCVLWIFHAALPRQSPTYTGPGKGGRRGVGGGGLPLPFMNQSNTTPAQFLVRPVTERVQQAVGWNGGGDCHV